MNVSRQHHLNAHSAALYALAPGRKSQTLFTGGSDQVVAEWDLESGEPNSFSVKVDDTIYSLLNIKQRYLVIGTSSGSMHVINLETNEEVRHLKLHDSGIFHLYYDQKGKRVYAACADGSVSVWNPEYWSLLWHLHLSDQKIRRIGMDHFGDLLAVASGDGKCIIIETRGHKIVHEITAHDESTNSLLWLPNRQLLTGGKDAHLRLWDTKKGFELIKEIPAHNYAIYDIVMNQRDGWIATASRDKTIKLWDMELEEKPLRIDRASHGGHMNSVNGLTYLVDENLLVSCSDDTTAMTWQVDA